MNLILNEATVAAGKLRAFMEREERFHALAAKQQGVRAILSVRSLGHPLRFARGAILESVQSAYAILESPEFEALQAANPMSGLATPVRPLELYESVVEVGEAAAALTPGMHMIAVEWTLDGRPGVAQAFEQSRRALFELRQKHGHRFVRSSMYRYLGTPNRYFVAHTSTNREAAMSGLAATELQAFQTGHPRSTYASTAPTLNEYEVAKVTRSA